MTYSVQGHERPRFPRLYGRAGTESRLGDLQTGHADAQLSRARSSLDDGGRLRHAMVPEVATDTEHFTVDLLRRHEQPLGELLLVDPTTGRLRQLIGRVGEPR